AADVDLAVAGHWLRQDRTGNADALLSPQMLALFRPETVGEPAAFDQQEAVVHEDWRNQMIGSLGLHLPEDVRLGDVTRAAAPDRLDRLVGLQLGIPLAPVGDVAGS